MALKPTMAKPANKPTRQINLFFKLAWVPALSIREDLAITSFSLAVFLGPLSSIKTKPIIIMPAEEKAAEEEGGEKKAVATEQKIIKPVHVRFTSSKEITLDEGTYDVNLKCDALKDFEMKVGEVEVIKVRTGGGRPRGVCNNRLKEEGITEKKTIDKCNKECGAKKDRKMRNECIEMYAQGIKE